MTLKEALGLQRRDMVALVGAGGKTTTLLRLARELWESGDKVLVTTTTKIFKPAKPHIHRLFIAKELDALLRQLAEIEEPAVVAVGHGVDETGKLIGLPLQWFHALKQDAGMDWILIEADGAAARLFKAPLEHEPVVPEQCTVAVWVMAIKVLDKPLTPVHVHRAGRVATLLGIRIGTPITEQHIVRLVENPLGCLKGIPPASRKVALLNQADSPEEVKKALALGRELLRHNIERVVITSYLSGDPVKEVLTS
ncbi:MAG: selenium cofactor biosynthesis protein YqeC [Candidatus Binatia bacterium]